MVQTGEVWSRGLSLDPYSTPPTFCRALFPGQSPPCATGDLSTPVGKQAQQEGRDSQESSSKRPSLARGASSPWLGCPSPSPSEPRDSFPFPLHVYHVHFVLVPCFVFIFCFLWSKTHQNLPS